MVSGNQDVRRGVRGLWSGGGDGPRPPVGGPSQHLTDSARCARDGKRRRRRGYTLTERRGVEFLELMSRQESSWVRCALARGESHLTLVIV